VFIAAGDRRFRKPNISKLKAATAQVTNPEKSTISSFERNLLVTLFAMLRLRAELGTGSIIIGTCREWVKIRLLRFV
jgi:hypothetical protein